MTLPARISTGVLTALLSVVAALLFAAPAFPAVTGAVFTTDSTCSGVDLNIYENKDDVYLDGGPKKTGSAGLNPGVYYVKVTDPSGATLLGTTIGAGNETPVEVDENGDFVTCYQLSAILIRASGLPGAVPGYDDTPSSGGEYKVWVSSESDFPSDENKTDNFKVIVDEEVPPADALTATKDATPSFDSDFNWEIEKEVDKTQINIAEDGTATFEYTVTVKHDEGTDGGWLVTGTITVNNPNSGAVEGIDVEDAINDANATCAVEGGSGATIPAESNEEFPYECTYSSEPESDSQTNTATVSWPEQTVDGELLAEGDTEAEAEVDWSSVEPEVTDGSIEVEDSLKGVLGTVTLEDENPKTFTYTYEFEGDPAGTCTEHDNTATFITSDSESTGEASQTVKVCVGADLEVEKTAASAFTRTFTWSVSKKVDKTKVVTGNATATFKYTIEFVKGAGVDSKWIVKGTITVTNPNDWEAITADVTDAINDANATCAVTGGDDAEIPAGESAEFEYECEYSAAPEEEAQTNTATATWDAEAASTPSGSAEGTAAIDWETTSPTEIDDCVETTDTVDGVSTQLDEKICESKTYNPELTFPVEPGCVAHNNTAVFKTDDTGTEGSSSQKVEVCGPLDTEARTIGFWQNKNGQKLITDGKETSKVCNSGTWLRQYNPFKDLSATANCKEVAAYVTKVIKAASAGGTSMNPMLKAQMLATALSVYFSDPALGGNKLGAPTPLGGVTIDLTNVCKNIPSCSVLENVSGAFGGATSMTVNEILAYAAGQSNSGGSSWYGQVKATQELAKDTFDAINNNVAFGP